MQQELRSELEAKQNYIDELERTVESYEIALKENKSEIQLLQIQLKDKTNAIAEYENNVVNREELHNLKSEIERKSRIIEDLDKELYIAKTELDSQSHDEDLHELIEVAESKSNRIEELENALRESVKIIEERERTLQHEEVKRKQIMEKVSAYLIFLHLIEVLTCSRCQS